ENDRDFRGGHGVDPAGRKQVLPVCDVDDAVGVRGRLLEPVEILEAAATHVRAQRGDLVPGGDELRDDVRTGMAGPAGDENAHVTVLFRVGGAQLRTLTPRKKSVCLMEWLRRLISRRPTFSSARAIGSGPASSGRSPRLSMNTDTCALAGASSPAMN